MTKIIKVVKLFWKLYYNFRAMNPFFNFIIYQVYHNSSWDGKIQVIRKIINRIMFLKLKIICI
jgi:hypothetical protein